MQGMLSVQTSTPTEITPGELTIPASVTIEYTLKDAKKQR